MVKKTCKGCGLELDQSEFYNRQESKKKLSSCKACRRLYQKNYYNLHRNRILKTSSRYYQNNKIVMQEYNIEWRERHPERVKEYRKREYGNRKKKVQQLSPHS